MKKIISTLILALFFIGFNTYTKAQCRQQFVYSCAKDNGNAIYLRDFNVKLRRQKSGDKNPPEARFSVVLNKGTRYRFNICDPDGPGKTVLRLMDGNKKLASTSVIDKATNKVKNYPSFDFVCQKSAIYHVSIYRKDGAKGCAVGILSFVEKIN